MSATAKRPELKVVFDSNAIFTRSAHHLASKDFSDLAGEFGDHSDIKITWILPEVVRHERQAQMLKELSKYLDATARLAPVIGDGYKVTSPMLEERLAALIKEYLVRFNIAEVALDSTRVDWKQMMLDAVYRRPPFEPGEKEKGFRDALVAETLVQIIDDSLPGPRSPIAFVCEDARLREAVGERVSHEKNVTVVGTIEELRGLINTLVSRLTLEYVKKILPKAQAMFFTKGNKDSLFYTKGIYSTILEKYGEQMGEVPEGADLRENGGARLVAPSFVRKEKDRIFWRSRVRISALAYAQERRDPQVLDLDQLVREYQGSEASDKSRYWRLVEILSRLGISEEAALEAEPPPDMLSEQDTEEEGEDRQLMFRGFATFNVLWSVEADQRQRLSSPRIEEIEYVSTAWIPVRN